MFDIFLDKRLELDIPAADEIADSWAERLLLNKVALPAEYVLRLIGLMMGDWCGLLLLERDMMEEPNEGIFGILRLAEIAGELPALPAGEDVALEVLEILAMRDRGIASFTSTIFPLMMCSLPMQTPSAASSFSKITNPKPRDL